MNAFYEWPRTRSEYNIFFKEVFRLPEFWPELFKKYYNRALIIHLGYLSDLFKEQEILQSNWQHGNTSTEVRIHPKTLLTVILSSICSVL